MRKHRVNHKSLANIVNHVLHIIKHDEDHILFMFYSILGTSCLAMYFVNYRLFIISGY